MQGVVTSDKCDKTRRVEIARRVMHPKYKKYVRRRTVCHVHDEQNASGIGDRVEIIECPPISKTKRWQLVRVLEKSTLVDVVALRAEMREQERQATGEKAKTEAESQEVVSEDEGDEK